MTGDPGWGADAGRWDEVVRTRLLGQRVVVLSGRLDAPVATRTAAELMTLDASGDEAVQLRLSSPDGELGAALALMDVVELLGVTLRADCLGLVGGPAIGVLAMCPVRRAAPHCRFRLVEPDQRLEGRAAELALLASSEQDRWALFCTRVAAAIGRAPEEVRARMATGRFLDAAEALEWGLVTEIAGPGAPVRSLVSPRPPDGSR